MFLGENDERVVFAGMYISDVTFIAQAIGYH